MVTAVQGANLNDSARRLFQIQHSSLIMIGHDRQNTTDRRTAGRTDDQTDRRAGGRSDGWMELTGGWMDGTKLQTDRWTDLQTDKQTDPKIYRWQSRGGIRCCCCCW